MSAAFDLMRESMRAALEKVRPDCDRAAFVRLTYEMSLAIETARLSTQRAQETQDAERERLDKFGRDLGNWPA